MNHKKLKQTHRHLTLVFTGVVFVIIMIVGFSFLVTKYISENNNQKRDIYSQIDNISRGMIENENFFSQYSRQRIIQEVKAFRPGDIRSEKGLASKLSFIVLDSENNLIFKEILQEPQFDTISFDAIKIYRDADTYIFTKNIGDNKVVFYQNTRYGLSDMGEDLVLLLILSIILSGAVYFVGHRFVGRALIPVEENLQDMTDFVHNAGHELKTPLAVMRGNLQIMQAEEQYDKSLLKKSVREIDNTNALLEGLIELSQIGSLSEKSSLAIAVEVKKAVSELEGLAHKKQVEIHNTVKGADIVSANIQELHILLMNLIKNAIKYNTKGGKVTISFHKNTLIISDTGVGISESEKHKIFQRFYQGDQVRSTEGFGIGLSLVKKIVDMNNWKIQLETELGKGSSFKIIF